jgi:hypothetical protein
MRRLVCACACLGLLAGCGGSAGDLLSIAVSGGFAGGAGHTIVVSGDGRGSCDRGPLKQLPAERVIDAREIEHDVADLARRAATYPPSPDARAYVLRTKAGTVRWSEGRRGLPGVLPRTQLLELQLQRILCPAR